MSGEQADLACQQVVELVTDYLEGALAPSDCARLEQHIVLCDACLRYVDQHRSVVRALAQLTPVDAEAERRPANPELRQALLDAFRKRRCGDEP